MQIAQLKRLDHVGFLVRGVRLRFFFFRLINFITNLGFATQTVFSSSLSVRVFLSAIFFLINLSLIVLAWPLKQKSQNQLNLSLSIAGVAQALLYLLLMTNNWNALGDGGAHPMTYFYWLIGLLVVLIVVILLITRCGARIAACCRRSPGPSQPPSNIPPTTSQPSSSP
jgi:hypothetical protein